MSESQQHSEINTPDTGFTDAFIVHAFTPQNVGVLSDPDGYGAPRGSCGDIIEIGLKVNNEVIQRAVFMTDGCAYTVACADMITQLAMGKDPVDALSITADDIMAELGGLPPDHVHCARLAVSTLKLAIKNYFKNKQAPWKKMYGKPGH
jgi:nitrogen fixation NifU-like protein